MNGTFSPFIFLPWEINAPIKVVFLLIVVLTLICLVMLPLATCGKLQQKLVKSQPTHPNHPQRRKATNPNPESAR
jgi:uncharacterized integral membrane protein